MSQADQEKWNERYREGAYATRTHPSALLAEWLPKPERRETHPRAIDVACGTGRNAIYLAQRGWQVDAVDVSEVALDVLAERRPRTTCPLRASRWIWRLFRAERRIFSRPTGTIWPSWFATPICR